MAARRSSDHRCTSHAHRRRVLQARLLAPAVAAHAGDRARRGTGDSPLAPGARAARRAARHPAHRLRPHAGRPLPGSCDMDARRVGAGVCACSQARSGVVIWRRAVPHPRRSRARRQPASRRQPVTWRHAASDEASTDRYSHTRAHARPRSPHGMGQARGNHPDRRTSDLDDARRLPEPFLARGLHVGAPGGHRPIGAGRMARAAPSSAAQRPSCADSTPSRPPVPDNQVPPPGGTR